MSLPIYRTWRTRGASVLAALLALCATAAQASAQSGAKENPPPITDWDDNKPKPTVDKNAPPPPPPGYPIELTRRPLTLFSGMSEVRFELPVLFFEPFRVRALLRADYGINENIQIGLSYGPGGIAPGDDSPFKIGKAGSVDVRYRITDWIAAQASLPMLFDPFSMGVTVGAPFKFTFLDGKLALFGGHDLLSVRIYRFVPMVGDPFFNQAQVDLDAVNTDLPRGELRFQGGVIYQIDPNLAFTGEMGILARDFGITDAGVPLLGTLTYSSSNKIDLGLRAGFENLDEAKKNAVLAVFAVVRI